MELGFWRLGWGRLCGGGRGGGLSGDLGGGGIRLLVRVRSWLGHDEKKKKERKKKRERKKKEE